MGKIFSLLIDKLPCLSAIFITFLSFLYCSSKILPIFLPATDGLQLENPSDFLAVLDSPIKICPMVFMQARLQKTIVHIFAVLIFNTHFNLP